MYDISIVPSESFAVLEGYDRLLERKKNAASYVAT